MKKLFMTLALALPLFGMGQAQAHIGLMAPTPRYSDLKKGPCGRGVALDARTTKVTTFKAGETITVTWKETVPHPGHYRIAFDPDGAHFTDPSSFTDTAPRMYVLKDNIADLTGTQVYSEQITLPNVACTNCTLQVMQVMTDKPPYGNGDDLYYQCADLILEGPPPDMAPGPDLLGTPAADLAAPADLGTPVPDPGMNTGCTVAPLGAAQRGAGGALGVALLAGALGLLRRRRR